MASELERNGDWQRLAELYRAMSDGELLGLAARPQDLTDTARDVLRGEMSGRRLQVEASGADAARPFAERAPDLEPVRTAPAKGMVSLIVFNDAIAAGEACDLLEQAEIEIEVKDVATPQSATGMIYGGPPVALQLIVKGADKERAMEILREKMGLFPLQEVEGTDAPVDDDTTAVLGEFGRREDADEAVRVLADAGFWRRVMENAEGSAETDDLYTVEVKEFDQARAVEAVERALGLPEG
jgi:hypothetical protein